MSFANFDLDVLTNGLGWYHPPRVIKRLNPPRSRGPPTRVWHYRRTPL
jgi:hypothetical protein